MQDKEHLEEVRQIPISEIRPFRNHPFKVVEDELMEQTVESIRQVGLVNPAIVRPRAEGGYEMVAGHRRQRAAELAGLDAIPAIVRNLSDDEAVVWMVDSNLQRETISPMERAWAYRMKRDALKRQGKRTDLTLDQVGPKSWVNETIGEPAGDSMTQVKRFIRLTELVSELQEMVDRKEIAFGPAVELSYLSPEEQRQFVVPPARKSKAEHPPGFPGGGLLRDRTADCPDRREKAPSLCQEKV